MQQVRFNLVSLQGVLIWWPNRSAHHSSYKVKSWKKIEIKIENLASLHHTGRPSSSGYYQQHRGYSQGGVAHGRNRHFWDPSVFITRHSKLFWQKSTVSELYRCPDWQVGFHTVVLAISKRTNIWLWTVVRTFIEHSGGSIVLSSAWCSRCASYRNISLCDLISTVKLWSNP